MLCGSNNSIWARHGFELYSHTQPLNFAVRKACVSLSLLPVACTQVKMFGSFVRWQVDLPPPDDAMPARMALTTIDAAVRYACGPFAGPVHINCQMREPLIPAAAPWDRAAVQVAHCSCLELSALSLYAHPLQLTFAHIPGTHPSLTLAWQAHPFRCPTCFVQGTQPFVALSQVELSGADITVSGGSLLFIYLLACL